MKKKDIIMLAAGLAAGTVAWIVARRRRKVETKKPYGYFKKTRHLTPAFANFKKHS